MTDQETGPPDAGSGAAEPIPFMQQVLDNPFLLLLIGIIVPTLLYTVWGVMEVIAIPMAQ